MTALYVYYRVQADQATTLLPAIARMQTGLRSAMPGLAAHLSRRVPAPSASHTPSLVDGTSTIPETWMETYQFNGHADHRAWLKLVEALDLAVGQLPMGIEGNRHVEWFERISA